MTRPLAKEVGEKFLEKFSLLPSPEEELFPDMDTETKGQSVFYATKRHFRIALGGNIYDWMEERKKKRWKEYKRSKRVKQKSLAEVSQAETREVCAALRQAKEEEKKAMESLPESQQSVLVVEGEESQLLWRTRDRIVMVNGQPRRAVVVILYDPLKFKQAGNHASLYCRERSNCLDVGIENNSQGISCMLCPLFKCPEMREPPEDILPEVTLLAVVFGSRKILMEGGIVI